MLDNPMTEKHTREALAQYPETLQAVFSAVNRLAYDACHTIEGPLGEGSGGRIRPFNYEKLVEATSQSIRAMARDKTTLAGQFMHRALANAALADTELDQIIEITEQEALARINSATSTDKTTFTEHGHHGRQYIARNTVARVMEEVLLLKP